MLALRLWRLAFLLPILYTCCAEKRSDSSCVLKEDNPSQWRSLLQTQRVQSDPLTVLEDAPMPLCDFTQAEESLLQKLFRGAKSYLEFGAGGSTVAAVSFGNIEHINVVESSKEWVDKLKGRSDVGGAEKEGRLKFHLVDIGPVGPFGVPTSQQDAPKFPVYSSAVDAVAAQDGLDLVLVDGRFRVACFLKALKISSPTTRIAIHDYSNREYYHLIEKYADKVESADKLSVFKKKDDADLEALAKDIESYEHQPALLLDVDHH